MAHSSIDRVGVLGAGIMGTGIACHLANAGRDVVLLDIPPPDGKGGRNAFAEGALKKALKARPAPLFHKDLVGRIQVGNLEDDLDQLASCQWVVEAVKEDIDIKRSLFERLEKVVPADAIISSNTSGLRLAEMTEGRTDQFRKQFLITHFFNPVRYMRLLELIAGPDTDRAVLDRMQAFAEDVLGKGVVWGKDTPNFVANRIGTYGVLRAIREMETAEASIEEMDAIFGPPLGRPKSALFRTLDMVGLDLAAAITQHSYEALVDDQDREMWKLPAWYAAMIEKGIYGAKSGGGFYKKTKKTEDNPKGLEVYDYTAGEYRALAKVRIPSLGVARNQDDLAERMKTVTFSSDRAGAIAWPVTRDTLLYAANLIGDIADDVAAMDDAMRWGFGWDIGLFESWDALGFEDVCARMEKDGCTLPKWVADRRAAGKTIYDEGGLGELAAQKDPRRASLATRKTRGAEVVKSNSGASLVDIGDGVYALEFHTKGNAIDADITNMLLEGLEWVEGNGTGMVLYNEGEHFSFGANLMLIFMLAQAKDWAQVEGASAMLQKAVQRIRYSSVPVIAAPHGMALGGGCEVVMAAASAAGARPHAELYTGLVEVGVGLIPGGGGCMNALFGMMERVPKGVQIDRLQLVGEVFQQIALAKVSTSAVEAQRLGYLGKDLGITLDRRRQLHDAKALVIGLAESGYRPPNPRTCKLPGDSGIATLSLMVRSMVQAGQASAHDALIAGKVANILCGGASGHTHEVTEQEVLDLEREAFLSLCGEEKSQARISHMLTTNKPLRN